MLGTQLRVFSTQEEQVLDLEARAHKNKQVVSHHAKGSIHQWPRIALYSNEPI